MNHSEYRGYEKARREAAHQLEAQGRRMLADLDAHKRGAELPPRHHNADFLAGKIAGIIAALSALGEEDGCQDLAKDLVDTMRKEGK